MRVLALIPARSGSKRIPGKNSRKLGGVPLIVWSIEAAKGIAEICDILVSTDDVVTADIASKAGAMVPWLRPASLATDTASSEDVGLHALKWYEDQIRTVDGLLLLQPTSPFRRRDTILRGIELFGTKGRRPVVGVSPAKTHPLRCFKIEGDVMRPFVNGGSAHVRSQDLPPVYEPNGAFYLVTPEHLRTVHSYYGDDVVPLPIERPRESIDIDTEWDWKIAEAALTE